jgi:hemerythrin-like domain-containing protein
MSASRRRFLAVLGGASAVLAADPLWAQKSPPGKRPAKAAPSAKKSEETKKEIEVAPAEDLMREHGVLRRILLIYDDSVRRLEAGQPVNAETLAGAAQLVRRFVEDYHEKLEEDYLFPRFQRAGNMIDLVSTLKEQHFRGRQLTNRVLELATPAAVQRSPERGQLTQTLQWFIRMYRPHAAREDTVLFPAFKQLVAPAEYDKLGDEFEDKENALFGKNGFEHVVTQIAELEETIGLADLKQFTPP